MRPNESFPLDDEWLFSHFDFDGRPDRIETPLQLDADQSFGCFVLFAATLENAMHGKEPRVNAFYANTKNQLLRRMLGIVLGRLKETTSEMIQKEFDDLGFNRQQQAFAWSWVRGNISLISR